MTIAIIPNANNLIVPPDFNFTAKWNDQSVIVTPGITPAPYVIDDATVYDDLSAETRLEGPISTEPPDVVERMEFTTANPSLAVVSSSGYVTSTGTGTTIITCKRKHVRRKLEIDAAVGVVTAVTNLISYNNDTLGKHVKDTIASLLATSTQTNIYTSGVTRNPNVWTGDLDLTGISYWNTTGGNNGHRGATLISPRHVLMANHFPVTVGDTIEYVTQAGVKVQRTLDSVITIVPSDPTYSSADMRIGKLNADVPETIKHYSIMPEDWFDYLTLYHNSELPIVACAQRRTIYQRWRRNYPHPSDNEALRNEYNTAWCYHELADQASANLVTGDSGQPTFFPINGELVLLGSHLTDVSHYLASKFKTEINAAMTTLGGGYTTTVADLTGFNYYG